MKRFDTSVAVGVLLLVAGVVFLLQSLGVLVFGAELVIGTLFALGGLVFLRVWGGNRTQNWWAVIPGMALLGIGALIGLGSIWPAAENLLRGGLFLGALSLAFWLVYLSNTKNWWAVIPGGVLGTLAALTILDEIASGPISGAFFFLGLAVTFALVAILPPLEQNRRWAYIPAGVTLILAVVIALSAASVINYVWPLLMVAGGVYLVLRARGSKREE
jgi:hypothetical protein